MLFHEQNSSSTEIEYANKQIRVSCKFCGCIQFSHGSSSASPEFGKCSQSETNVGALAPSNSRPEQSIPFAHVGHDALECILLGWALGNLLPPTTRARCFTVDSRKESPVFFCFDPAWVVLVHDVVVRRNAWASPAIYKVHLAEQSRSGGYQKTLRSR